MSAESTPTLNQRSFTQCSIWFWSWWD